MAEKGEPAENCEHDDRRFLKHAFSTFFFFISGLKGRNGCSNRMEQTVFMRTAGWIRDFCSHHIPEAYNLEFSNHTL